MAHMTIATTTDESHFGAGRSGGFGWPGHELAASIGQRPLLDALLNHAAVGIAVARDRRVLYVNAAMATLVDRPPQEIIGQSTRILYATEDDHACVGAAYGELRVQGEAHVRNVRVANATGRLVLTDIHMQVCTSADGQTVIAMFLDVTDREIQAGQLQRAQRLYRALIFEGNVLLRSRSEHAMLRDTCRALTAATCFHAAWIGRPDKQGRIRMLAQAGEGAAGLANLDIPLTDEEHGPLVVRAWKTRSRVFNNDHLGDPRLAPWREFLQKHRWYAALAAPVWRRGEIWAVLVFVSPERDVFDAETLRLCDQVADLLGHGLDQFDLREHLTRQQRDEAYRARHDPLTGLPNRSVLEEFLPQAIARAKRLGGTVVAVGFIDLDGFKLVNDEFGHAVGDELLRQLAGRLKPLLRGADLVVRLGGDEFVIVLNDLDADRAMTELQTALNRLHGVVEAPFDLGDGKHASVGMTVGVALYPADGVDSDALLRKADAAMYLAKSNKADRSLWWSLDTGKPPSLPSSSPDVGAYGVQAGQILRRHFPSLEKATFPFVETFYHSMLGDHSMAAILRSLDAAEFGHLKRRQVEHLCNLFAPEKTPQDVVAAATQLGRVHALCGVKAGMLAHMASRYRAMLKDQWIRLLPEAANRVHMAEIVNVRIADDLRAQMESHGDTIGAMFSYLGEPISDANQMWIDTVRQEIERLAQQPGTQMAAIVEPNIHGVFHFLCSGGAQAQAFVDDVPADRYPVVDGNSALNRGLVGQCWRNRRIITTAALQRTEGTEPWRDLFVRLNMRSAVAVPIFDQANVVCAVLLVYGAYPNQYESSWARNMLGILQVRWNQIWRLRKPERMALSLSQTQSASRLRRLFSGGLQMWMQPLVDLRSGKVVKVESLARLCMPSGKVFGPAEFLPLLGRREQRRLFDMGLEQSLRALRQWEEDGVVLDVSFNLPPSLLHDSTLPDLLQAALRDAGISPKRLTLELLESEELDSPEQERLLLELKSLGFKIAIDDLGAGYGSLQRMKDLPISVLKIDQGLVSGLHRDPLRVLSMVSAMVRLGKDLDFEVVVEGLEDDALIEMARVVGADYGQGYGLARPMPAQDVAAWVKGFTFHAGTPLHTALGVLSYQRMVTRDSDPCRGRIPDPEDCPIRGFLTRNGMEDSLLAQAHAQFQAGVDVAENSACVTAQLVALVREELLSHAPSPS
ncbi:sensory box protein [Burkholderiales bacterium GJ-E10]|nr:sensory box protein [Burkholderiales bacterium GJ-E10]